MYCIMYCVGMGWFGAMHIVLIVMIAALIDMTLDVAKA